MNGVTDRRRALVNDAEALRAAGWLQRDIADEMGISRAMVSELLNDPDRAKVKARKASYALPCPTCGGPMDGSSGKTHTPKHCRNCAHLFIPGRLEEDDIIRVFQEFHAATGRAPTATDAKSTSPSQRARLTPTRLAELDANTVKLPQPPTVCRVFGSWRAAIIAAGLTPALVGVPALREPLAHWSFNQRGHVRPGSFAHRIMERLKEGPAHSSELARMPGVTRAGVAAALRPHVKAGNVIRTRNGHGSVWRLAEPPVEE